MERVFVSYRRQDTALQAHVIKTIIEARLDQVAVFVDTTDIPPGVSWPESLRRELDRSAAVLVLIGPRWRGGPGEPDRLIEPNDWVCQEVEAALARKPGHILPVVIEQASSRMERLPESIVDLSSLQAVMLDTFRWDADVERIVGWVAEVLDAGVLTAEEGFPSPDKIKALSPPLSDKVIEQMLQARASTAGSLDQPSWSERRAAEDRSCTRCSSFRISGGRSLSCILSLGTRTSITIIRIGATCGVAYLCTNGRGTPATFLPPWTSRWPHI